LIDEKEKKKKKSSFVASDERSVAVGMYIISSGQ
jgi:hypothetical protein